MYVNVADIELKHLTALRAIAATKSFGRAAELLGYTQSAVSQQVAGLERAVGAPLFRRPGGPRPVEITEAGTTLLAHADAIFEQLDQARHALDGLAAGTSGRLAIGSFQSASVRLLPGVVRVLGAERPDLELHLFESDDTEALIAQLERRELDASFLIGGLLDHGFDEAELFHDPFVAIRPPGSPSTPISMHELRQQPMIGQQPSDSCQQRIEAGLRSHGVQPAYVFRSGDNSAVQAMVRAGRGVAVMPRLAVDLNDPDIVITGIDPPIPPRPVTIAWRRGPDVSPAVERFVELSRQVGRELSTAFAV